MHSDHKQALSRRRLMTGAAAVGLTAASAAPISETASAKAPFMGAERPSFYRFDLGDFEVTTLLDGAIKLDGPHPIFGENVEQSDVQMLAEQNFLPPPRW